MMPNRIEGMLYPEDSPAIPVYRHPAPPESAEELAARCKRWAVEHPIPCLIAAFTLGTFVAWFVKRR